MVIRMSNKGFTLIELVGSIVILAVIALIAFPALLSMLNNSQKNVDDSVKGIIESAAEEYVNDHIDDYPASGTLNHISICDLVNQGYISVSFYEKNKQDIDGSSIKVVYDNKYKFTYKSDGGGRDCLAN